MYLSSRVGREAVPLWLIIDFLLRMGSTKPMIFFKLIIF